MRTYTEVTGFNRDGNRVTGVLTRDTMTGEETTIGCKAVINATGAWAGFVAKLLDVEVKVVPVKGVMVVLSHRVAHATINRCHKPGDGDIIVPALSVAILGTTAVKVPHPEVLPIEWDEVRHMIEEGSLMADGVSTARAMRAYAGVRPLYDLGAEDEGREMSRNFAVIDHEQRDGIAGFTSIVGGKVTTYRLMAERVTDLVARRLGVTTPCITADVPLNDRDDELDQLRHRPTQLDGPTRAAQRKANVRTPPPRATGRSQAARRRAPPAATRLRVRAGPAAGRRALVRGSRGPNAGRHPPPHPDRNGSLPGGDLRLPAGRPAGNRPPPGWSGRNPGDGRSIGDPLARGAARLLGEPVTAGPGHGRGAPGALQPRSPVDVSGPPP